MSEEDWKDLGIIKNKWVETKDDCLDMALNIFDKIYQENKELKEKDYDHFAYIKRIDNLEQTNKELQQRIDKVIDYINGESPDAGVNGHYIKSILEGDK